MSIQSGNNCKPYLFIYFRASRGKHIYFWQTLSPFPSKIWLWTVHFTAALTNGNLGTCSFPCNGGILTLLSNSSHSVILDIQTLFQSPLQMTLQFMSMRCGASLYVIRYLYSATPGILLEKDLQHQNCSF